MNAITHFFSETQLNTLSPEAPTPLYFQLYTLLKESVLNGTFGNGMQMPTEQQLAEAFGVSRITAKRAMDELAVEDLVQRRRGKGTHVTYDYTPTPVSAPLLGLLLEIERLDMCDQESRLARASLSQRNCQRRRWGPLRFLAWLG